MVGATASGKTDLSLKLAEDIFEIVSADSVQVYKYLDVGSGKPEKKYLKKIKHHLIDVVDPDYWFTAGDFCRRASQACKEISQTNKIPMFVGGTGLYLDSFFDGLSEIPVVRDSVREGLKLEIESRGLNALYQELLLHDPEFAVNIHPNDKQRIMRGLEVFRGFKKPISSFYGKVKACTSGELLFMGLYMERSELNKRIEDRVDRMIASGLEEEVLALRDKGYGPELNSMKSIGYAQINEYIDGGIDLNSAIDSMKTNTKKYAKRQLTWFKRNKKIKWFEVGNYIQIRDLVYSWIDKRGEK